MHVSSIVIIMVPVTQQWVDSCVITQQSLNAARLGNRDVGVKTWRSIGNVGGVAYLEGSRFTSHVAVLAPYVKYMSCFWPLVGHLAHHLADSSYGQCIGICLPFLLSTASSGITEEKLSTAFPQTLLRTTRQ